MKQIDKIVKGIIEPTDINVLWLDTNDKDKPILKAYNNGAWSAISNGGDSPEPTPTEGVVSYEPQTLTEAQQMQARKNQGLYYTEIIPDQLIVEWDGNTDGLIWIDEKEA